MPLNPDVFKAVVVVNSNAETAFGFPTVSSAVAFVEGQAAPDKAFMEIQSALTEGTTINGNDFQIFDIDTYIDVFMDEEEE